MNYLQSCQLDLIKMLEKTDPIANRLLTLNKKSEILYHSDLLKDIFDDKSFIYLEVKVNQEVPEWHTRFERGVKLGSINKIHEIFASAVSGVKLKYAKRPPSAITVKPNCEYFQILTEGPYWQQVIDDEHLAILINKEFIFAKLNLIIVDG